MESSKVGKRGTVVIPAALRRRFGITEGSLVIAEAREDGILIRPAVAIARDPDRRRQLLEETNSAYAAIRADAEAWCEELAEREAWEATLLDGLEADEGWSEEEDGAEMRRDESGSGTAHG